MPKKRVVASFVGNFSPVNRRTPILVSRVLHFRGDMGEELNSRAGNGQKELCAVVHEKGESTILKYRSPVQLEAGTVGILVFLCVAHG